MEKNVGFSGFSAKTQTPYILQKACKACKQKTGFETGFLGQKVLLLLHCPLF